MVYWKYCHRFNKVSFYCLHLISALGANNAKYSFFRLFTSMNTKRRHVTMVIAD